MARVAGQIEQLAAVAVALVVAVATALLVVLASSAQMDPAGPGVPISQLPGLPGEAPVLAPAPSMPEDKARARNAADPFLPGTIAPAPPFRFAGSATDFDRARECLALAALAEAGPSDTGQRAVVQVILNRVRHPAFARTVCGVVFEGAQRETGCQFSFTCDGSLAREYGTPAWLAARQRAEAALKGYVFRPIGNATHYHTDWVYPAWSPHLVKLAQVETHLFFRWPGYWGTPGAMRIAYRGGEPDVAALEGTGAAEAVSPQPSFAPLPPDTPRVSGGEVAVRDPTGRANFMVLGSPDPARALLNARALCGAAATCRVMGWSDRAAVPAAFPLPPAARAALKFSYSRDPAGTEIALYACDWFEGAPAAACIPRAR